jgi:hypothetical protein
MFIPWTGLGVTRLANQQVGLEIHATDNDGATTRENKISWKGLSDIAWNTPTSFGIALLSQEQQPVYLKQIILQGNPRFQSKLFNLQGQLIQ